MASILIIDDEEKMTSVLARMLARDGYEVETATLPSAGLALLAAKPFDILLCDLRMPEMSGVEVLERARRASPGTDCVMMTAYATVQTAIEAMKHGALDYLIKPFPYESLRTLVERIAHTRAERDDTGGATSATMTPAQPPPRIENLVASSAAMAQVLARVHKVAPSAASVLLRGESGTGKEVLARAIHALSPRAAGLLVCVNCGAIPENLLESELFGHVKGAFTGAVESRKGYFETAHGGTIFLDEIGELPIHLQVKLLRVLQEGEIQRVGESTPRKVDARIIAATNRDLEAAIAAGNFRQDLYYRLNVIPIVLPPLRERPGDLPLLIAHFLRRYLPPGQKARTLSPAAEQLLLSYHYPGNIRELENAIEHAVVLSDGPVIEPSDLPLQVQSAGPVGASLAPAGGAGATGGTMHLEDMEKALIMSALEKTRFNHTRAASHLGITRRTLGYRIQKYGLQEAVEQGLRRVREGQQPA